MKIKDLKKKEFLSFEDQLELLKLYIKWFNKYADTINPIETKIKAGMGGTINYEDVKEHLLDMLDLILQAEKTFKMYPAILHCLMDAEEDITQGIHLCEWMIGERRIKPGKVSKVGVAILRATYDLEDAYKEGKKV